jgi:hypothetical protein
VVCEIKGQQSDLEAKSPYQQPPSHLTSETSGVLSHHPVSFKTRYPYTPPPLVTLMVTIIDPDNLPHPGSTFFLPSLLAHIRAAAPGLPLEPVIIQVLLLCIVSGNRNLILRTREEDIGLVSRLTTIVSTLKIYEQASH